jgi:hypothetical protein
MLAYARGGEMKKTGQVEIERKLVAYVIDDALQRSERLRRMTRRILKAQRKLRRLVDDDAWAAYLSLEDAANARSSKQMDLLFTRMLAVYAFAMGARSGVATNSLAL